METNVDVVIAGGGPGGLAAALALARARKRVLLCDAGPRRNAAATHIHNFVTRDGTPPDDFRRVGREQLAHYPNVTVRDVRIESIVGARGAFRVALADGAVHARRILLCTGMIDEMLPIEGFRALWGTSIFQCPYCHGWEIRDRAWGYLVTPARAEHLLPFALQARGWTGNLTVFTNGAVEVTDDAHARLRAAGIRLATAPIARLVAANGALTAVELAGGARIACEALFAHPPQRHVELVGALGLALDDEGFVKVDAMRATSVAGIYASGDLTMRMQSAIFAAASGVQAAAAINVDLAMDPATYELAQSA